jgi:hypothetical protein
MEYGMAKFEVMKQFKIFFPHNNYDRVIERYYECPYSRLNRFSNQEMKIRRHKEISPYTSKSFAAKRIKLIRKIIEYPFTRKNNTEPIVNSSRNSNLL